MSGYGLAPCCTPQANFPRPTDRHEAGRSFHVSAPNRNPQRRPTFFSRRVQRASYLMQNPTHITFREFVIVVLAIYAIYRCVEAGSQLRRLLTQLPVTDVCYIRGQSGLSCLYSYMWQVFSVLLGWGKVVVPWAFIAAVVVFFGEEAMSRLGGRK